MTDPGPQIETLRERVSQSDEFTDDDREALLEFSDELYLLQTKYGDYRHLKLLRHCTRMAEHVGGLADALEDRDAAEEIVRWINRTYDNTETNRDYRVALRVFGRRTVDENGDEPPESIEWVPSGTPRNYDPSPDPGDMLHWKDDVVPMIDATMNARDAALIATAWDSGARSGEIRSLEVGDVTDNTHGLQITLSGKTGQRTVTLIPAVPYLQRWLADHPAHEDPAVPLWCKLGRPEAFSYRMFTKILESAAERAGVEKPVTFTNFRKSSASFLASEGMNQAHIEDHHGWVRGSDVAARYVSVFGGSTEREIARIHGKDVTDEETDPLGPVECPRCSRETPRDEPTCMWCGQVLDRASAQEVTDDQASIRRELLQLVQNQPDLLDRVDEFERLVALADDDPELILETAETMGE